MYMKNSESEHMIGEVEHNECVELAKELAAEVEAKGYPEHVIQLIQGIVGELEEYAQHEDEMDEEGNKLVDEEEISDEKLEEEARKEMAGEKPTLMIKIKSKK